MKIVILGAGASFDSINKFHDEDYNPKGNYGGNYEHEWKPPLGNDIFGSRNNFREIREKYKNANSITSVINSENDIEDYFQKKWQLIQETNNTPIGNQLIHTQYYLQELFYEISNQYDGKVGNDNYSILLNWAHDYTLKTKEEVAFITFNYDILLDRAFQNLYEIDNISEEDYINRKIKILKPHGSCNWFKLFKSHNNGEYLVEQTLNKISREKLTLKKITENLQDSFFISEAPLQKTLNPNGLPPIYQYKDQNSVYAVYPQILIPIKTKDDFIMPESHLRVMESCLKETSELLIIGWKGEEKHFLSTLEKSVKNNTIKATIISPESEQLIKNLTSILPNIKTEHFNKAYHDEIHREGKRHFTLYHDNGTFSSYILNIGKNNSPNFFEKIK